MRNSSAAAAVIASAAIVIGACYRWETNQEGDSERAKSLELTNTAATTLGVRPAPVGHPRWFKRMFFKVERALIPLLFGGNFPDSKLSLRILWYKALSATDTTSPVFDNNLLLDLLPSPANSLVPIMSGRYPRYMLTTVEVRTAYLNRLIKKCAPPKRKVRLITLGAGYDEKSVALRHEGIVDEAVELDLPQVIQAKTRLLDVLLQKRPHFHVMLPELHAIDLNQVSDVHMLLEKVVKKGADWHTIFVFEGILMYLNDGVPAQLLKVCRESLHGSQGSLVFADRLERVTGRESAQQELQQNGWLLVDWMLKGGATKHMGRAIDTAEGST